MKYKWLNQESRSNYQQRNQQNRKQIKNGWSDRVEDFSISRLGAIASSITIWLLGEISIAGMSLAGISPIGISPAIAQRITTFDLDQAVCANNWPEAISLVTILMAQDTTTSAQRTALLSLRRQLERYQSENVLVTDEIACIRSDAYYLRSASPADDQPNRPLGWENAVIEATENRFSTEIITESVELTLPVITNERPGLSSAIPVDLSQGLNVVSGHVGQGHNVYGFVAGLGDRLDVRLDVTRVMTGSLYTSDDSQLFLFDRNGTLLAAADDSEDSAQSQLTDITIPKTDLYFAVVTTYNNDPILNRNGHLTGWQDNGGGRFDYTLTLSGVTPTEALVR